MTQTLKIGFALIAFLVLTALAAGVGTWTALRYAPQEQDQVSQILPGQPGMDAVDNYRCPRHLNKSVHIFGVEDGYDRSNVEPARYHPAFYFSPNWVASAQGEISSMGVRDYDEAGTDKKLFDHFTFPENVQSTHLIVRLTRLPGGRNDGVNIRIPILLEDGTYSLSPITASGISYNDLELISDSHESADKILSGAITKAVKQDEEIEVFDLHQHLREYPKNRDAIIVFQDDHQIDFAALIFCSSLNEQRGTTFHERNLKALKAGRSLLACTPGDDLPGCDAHRGDLNCDSRIPLACYRPGDKSFEGFSEPKAVNTDYFTGGEVRLTRPVAGSDFKTRGDVNRFCADSFGEEWRPLQYHEAGGGAIATWSEIEDSTRVWIDVYGSNYANCWSPDMSPSKTP